MISAKYKNICVVGDADQTIFGFRGSNYRNILNFESDYQNAKVILLEENYRSTKTILEAANNVIRNNKMRKEKNLWCQNETGLKIKYYRAFDEKDEADYIVSEIKRKIDEANVSFEEIVVLYRTHAQSRTIEEALLRANLPFKVVGSFHFYERKEIKDLMAYLRLIYNEKDNASLLRAINVPKRGIGDVTVAKLQTLAEQNNKSIYEVIESGKELKFKELIEEFKALADKVSLTDLVEAILVKTGMRQELINDKTLESDIR